ncbi:MAG: GAF domain-containing protein, partial [Planctomycetota bacterium]
MTPTLETPPSMDLPSDASLLDAVGEGVLVVNVDEHELYAGERLARWPAAVREQVRRVCIDVLRHDAADRSSRRFQLAAGEDHHLEVVVGRSTHDREQVAVAVIFDASEHRRLQRKIDAIDKAGAELVRIESQAVDAMTPAERLKVVEERVIRATRDLMSFDHFCIRLVDPNGSKLEPVLSDGLPPEALDVELVADDEANGISGYVARTGRSYICHDVGRDSRYIPGLDGAQSSLTVPLTLDDTIVGVLNVESRSLGAFDEDDRQFAEIFGRYVAIAMSILRLLVSERAATNKKVADNVAGEVAGPLNDIALDAQSLLDDFVGEEKLHDRLRAILQNVEQIREGMRDASKGPNVLLGTRSREVSIEPEVHDAISGARVLVV